MNAGIFENTLKVLNEALAADRGAVNALIEHRVPCNEALEAHQTIQVGGTPTEVGMLGILNGIIEPLTGKRIAAKWCDDTGTNVLTEFIEFVPKPNA